MKVPLLDLKVQYASLEGEITAAVPAIFTDWQEFKTPDFKLTAEKLGTPVIFDGRNLCDPAYAAKKGIEYISIGRTYNGKNL